MPERLVVVLGYSSGRNGVLHPICAARVALAGRLVRPGDAVLLSGWSRHPTAVAEAELMRDAWSGAPVDLLADPDARVTAENAANAAVHARELGVGEVVVVTSWWHRFRARILFRALAPGLRVSVAAARTPWSPRLLLRELAVTPLVPLQIARARRRAATLSGPAAAVRGRRGSG
ncbi:MAG TPA: YdcF family protein [Gaiellaceae bacterium]|nr:YdcF family protein [Gaiellaceae bacterium]